MSENIMNTAHHLTDSYSINGSSLFVIPLDLTWKLIHICLITARWNNGQICTELKLGLVAAIDIISKISR